jgi:integrase/recombinase XerD
MAIQSQFTLNYFLDQRKQKVNGKYPVKVTIYETATQNKKRYASKFEFANMDEFNSVWNSKRPQGEKRQLRDEMQAVLNEVTDIANSLDQFSFEAFEEKFLKKVKGVEYDIQSYYAEVINRLNKNKQFGTANTYSFSIKALMEFHGKPTLKFDSITPQWLIDFENHLTEQGRSRTTVGIYLRTLRAIFNNCIADKIIPQEQYPFGRRRYVIPAPKAVKKALTKEQLKVLFDSAPQTPEQVKAKDFWFLSYACNGANINDILNWKWKNLSGDVLTFVRAKTVNTKKDMKPIVIYLNEFVKNLIKKYGNPDQRPDAFIFPILSHNATPEQNYMKIKTFTKFVNVNLLKLAKSIGINEPISTYWARHSFTTSAINKGASLEFIGEALGHSDIKTTIGYFAGFESETKKQFSQSLMEF